MPIGKDSITKRVAKQIPANDIVTETLTPPQTEDKNIAPELVATVGVAPAKKAPAKKSASTAKKTTTAKATTAKATTAKATASSKPAEKKPATPKQTTKKTVETKQVETAVLANVSPETVAAVIGHKENEKYEKVQVGQKLPTFLL